MGQDTRCQWGCQESRGSGGCKEARGPEVARRSGAQLVARAQEALGGRQGVRGLGGCQEDRGQEVWGVQFRSILQQRSAGVGAAEVCSCEVITADGLMWC